MKKALNELESIGIFEIHPEKYFLRLCLDVCGASTKEGGSVILYPRNQGQNQRFRIRHFARDQYVLEAVHSGFVLDIYKSGGEGSKLCQYPFHGGKNQLWTMDLLSNGGVRFLSVHQQLCLTGMDLNETSGGSIAVQRLNTSCTNHQSFILSAIE